MALIAKLVPSSSKESEWKKFAKMIEQPPKKSDTSRELLLLHRIFSNGADSRLLCEEREENIRLMYFLDRSDLDRKGYERLLRKAGRNRYYLLGLPIEDFEENLGKMDIGFNPAIRGHLRAYGKRLGKNGWEKVYASHTFAPDIKEGEIPKVYFGLSPRLDIVYLSFCWKYDLAFSLAQTLDEKLLAESFLHLVGTHLIHPFWDGNGRTFTAHLALMLAREGILVREYEQIRKITEKLINIDGEFLEKVLMRVGIGLISHEDHPLMLFDIDHRRRYMNRLRAVIQDAIDSGVQMKGPYFDDYSLAKETMRDWLENLK